MASTEASMELQRLEAEYYHVKQVMKDLDRRLKALLKRIHKKNRTILEQTDFDHRLRTNIEQTKTHKDNYNDIQSRGIQDAISDIIRQLEEALYADFQGEFIPDGSHEDGTRVGRVTEYDFVYKIGMYVPERLTPVPNTKVPAALELRYDGTTILPHDVFNKFYKTVTKLMEEVVKPQAPLSHGGFASPLFCGVRINEPAVTLLFSCTDSDNTDCLVSVDMAPSIPLPLKEEVKYMAKISDKLERIFQENPNTTFLKRGFLHLVASMPEQCYWFVTSSCLEAYIIRSLAETCPVKRAIKTCKRIRADIIDKLWTPGSSIDESRHKYRDDKITKDALRQLINYRERGFSGEAAPSFQTQESVISRHEGNELPIENTGVELLSSSNVLNRQITFQSDITHQVITEVMLYAHILLPPEAEKLCHELTKIEVTLSSAAIKHIALTEAMSLEGAFSPTQNPELEKKLLKKIWIKLAKDNMYRIKHFFLPEYEVRILAVACYSVDHWPRLKNIIKEQCGRICEALGAVRPIPSVFYEQPLIIPELTQPVQEVPLSDGVLADNPPDPDVAAQNTDNATGPDVAGQRTAQSDNTVDEDGNDDLVDADDAELKRLMIEYSTSLKKKDEFVEALQQVYPEWRDPDPLLTSPEVEGVDMFVPGMMPEYLPLGTLVQDAETSGDDTIETPSVQAPAESTLIQTVWSHESDPDANPILDLKRRRDLARERDADILFHGLEDPVLWQEKASVVRCAHSISADQILNLIRGKIQCYEMSSGQIRPISLSGSRRLKRCSIEYFCLSSDRTRLVVAVKEISKTANDTTKGYLEIFRTRNIETNVNYRLHKSLKVCTNPGFVACCPDDGYVVFQSDSLAIFKYSKNGKVTAKLVLQESTYDMCLSQHDADLIYVCHKHKLSAYRFGKDGEEMRIPALTERRHVVPRAVCCLPSGDIYISDWQSRVIIVYHKNGSYMRTANVLQHQDIALVPYTNRVITLLVDGQEHDSSVRHDGQEHDSSIRHDGQEHDSSELLEDNLQS